MADRDRRGGYQAPRQPAPVSNPGSGRRTDGGAGNARQPIRVPTGGRYGEAQALRAQQQGAPMPNATGGSAPATPGPSAASSAAAPTAGGGVFGPTQRPNESPAAGAMTMEQALVQSPEAVLRMMYQRFPHPTIARLLNLEMQGPRR